MNITNFTRYLILSICLLLSNKIHSQVHMNSSFSVFMNELEKMSVSGMKGEAFKSLVNDYDLLLLEGKYFIGVQAVVDKSKIKEKDLHSQGVINDTRLDNIWTFRVPVDNIFNFLQIEGLVYVETGSVVSPSLERAIPSARVDSVHMGLGGLSQGYTGKGVIIGIIDWGFDYTHPNFYDTSLTQTRILRAWDQNKLSGPPPSGYSFGTEYVGADQLLAAGCDTLYVFGPSSHGTHVAGIAAGSGAGTVHRGVAFESDLIFVSLRRDAPSLLDAFSYIANHAAALNKPFVINMSFGSHLGPHDGTSLKNLGIDLLHGPGKIFVGSAGNNGSATTKFHLDRDFTLFPDDTLKTVVMFANNPDQFGQALSMWGSEFSDFAVSVCMVNSNDSILFQTPFYSTLDEPTFIDTVLVGNDSLIIRTQSTSSHFLNNKPNIRLELSKTGTSKIVIKVVSQNTHLHIWNIVRMNNRYTNWGTNLTNIYPGAVEGDNTYGLGEPAGVGKNVITVASYRAEFINPNTGTIFLGNISGFSSRGPTVDNRTKPDIASAGEAVFSSVNSFDPNYQNTGLAVEFNGTVYRFVSFSGTSMSAPMVSGIVALMLEAFPVMSAVQAKEILKITARLDINTGDIGNEGHLQWGWGKANALAAVKAAETLQSVENISIVENLFRMFPNPAADEVVIQFENKKEETVHIDVFSMSGKQVISDSSIGRSEVVLQLHNLSSGMYLVRVKTTERFSIKQLLIVR